jgi:hypothetical protein
MPLITTQLLILAAASASVSVSTQLSPTAAEFTAQGAQTVFETCDLPKRKCKDSPLKLKSADVGGPPGAQRSYESFVADGMTAMVIFNTANRTIYQFGYVEISKPKWSGYKGVMIGSTRDAVVQNLGEPNNGTNNSCDVYFDEAHEASASICYQSGVVSRIRWEFPID